MREIHDLLNVQVVNNYRLNPDRSNATPSLYTEQVLSRSRR